MSNLLFKIPLIPLEGGKVKGNPRLDDELTNRRFVSLRDDDDPPTIVFMGQDNFIKV